MALSATLGGTVEIDARAVRIIPYNTGTGNVPAYNTVVSQGGASGKLIGVYSALNVAPTTPGSAMPASGFIKIKQWNSTPYSAGTLSGIGASATGADRAGWIEVVADEALNISVNRLNLFRVRGDWFEIDTTDGNRATTYQIPSNGVNQYHAGVWVETSPGSDLYEFYPCAGTKAALAANIAADDSVRGKFCWISAAGVLRFGNDGTNSTGGYVPQSGCKIRMPNVFMVACTTAARTNNSLPNATLATRPEFATTGGGALEINNASCAWYLNVNQGYSFNMTNTSVCTAIVATEIASEMTWSNVGVGQEAANSQTALTLSLCFAGGTFTDCTFSRAAQASSGHYVALMNDLTGFTFDGIKLQSLTRRANATTGSLSATRVNSTAFMNTTLGGGRAFLVTCDRVNFNNSVYYDDPAVNTTSATGAGYGFDLSSSCTNITIDGLAFGGLNLVQPYNGILQVGAAGCQNIKLRNIGTYDEPLSLGSPRVDDAAWSRVTTTATVTSPSHGFAVNDTIYVVVSSDTAAITVAAKTITAVPTADTFQFAALNAGATSGTLCYFGTKCANVFVLATSAAANNVEIKRVYAPHTRTNLYTTDNSSKNITLENVFSDYLNAPLIAMLNGFFRNVSGTPPLTAQSSVYGTHWFDGYVCDVADNTSAQSWSRSSTTVTVTSPNHRLRTGMLISVVASSSTAAVPMKSYSVTAISSSQFTITGLNAGSTSGTIDYRVANGRIGIQMNEATEDTLDAYTIISGTPKFTSAGGLVMANVGDKITFETLEYILGQGSTFPVFDIVLAGGGSVNNFKFTYQIDKNDGNGFGSEHVLRHRIPSGVTYTSGQYTITVPDSSIFEVGDRCIQGGNTGIEWNARVVSIDSSTQITVDTAHTASGSNTSLIYTHLPEESDLGPDTGIKFRWTIETITANTTAITSLYIQSESTTVGRAYQYPLDTVDATLTLTNLRDNSEVRIYRASDDVELAGIENSSGGEFSYDYTWIGVDVEVYIVIHHLNYLSIRYEGQLLGELGLTLPIQQQTDRQYLNP